MLPGKGCPKPWSSQVFNYFPLQFQFALSKIHLKGGENEGGGLVSGLVKLWNLLFKIEYLDLSEIDNSNVIHEWFWSLAFPWVLILWSLLLGLYMLDPPLCPPSTQAGKMLIVNTALCIQCSRAAHALNFGHLTPGCVRCMLFSEEATYFTPRWS